jgi:hypothetical protein
MTARHTLALGAAVVAIAGSISGCNASLSNREVVVHFSSTATGAQHTAARQACASATPKASPEPIVHNKFASTRIDDVRFRVDKANDYDLAKLYNCLSKQPGVIGVSDPLEMTR